MTETLAHGYSSENTQRELSNEYQHDRFWMFFKKSVHSFSLEESSLNISMSNLRVVKELIMVITGTVISEQHSPISAS